MFIVNMLSAIYAYYHNLYLYDACDFADCHYPERHYFECRYDQCHDAINFHSKLEYLRPETIHNLV